MKQLLHQKLLRHLSNKQILIIGLVLVCVAAIAYQVAKKTPKTYVTGLLIPHHLVAKDLINQTLSEVDNPPTTIIFLAPNHQEAGNFPIITMSEHLTTNEEIGSQPEIIAKEHAVNDLTPIFKKYFPSSQIVPLIISNFTKSLVINNLVNVIKNRTEKEKVLIIATVDFAHYLPPEVADKNDQETLQLITTRQYDGLRNVGNTHADSPATLVAFFKLMDSLKSTCVMHDHQNSARLLEASNHNTTSYFTFVCTTKPS